MTYFTETSVKQNPFASWVQTTLGGLKKRHQAHKAYRTTFDELTQLSDRELADLGLSRGNIRYIAREAAEMQAG